MCILLLDLFISGSSSVFLLLRGELPRLNEPAPLSGFPTAAEHNISSMFTRCNLDLIKIIIFI